jgi:glycosyltransferase involved in cell wall biosynthesis
MKHTVVLFGRVSTSIKAGIPAHVLSLAQAYSSDPDIEFINLVPSLIPNRKTRASRIFPNFLEIECSSIYARKTFSISLSFFWHAFLLSLRYRNPAVHLHLPDPLSLIACLIFYPNKKIIATYHADLLNKGSFSLVNRALVYILSKLNTTFVIPTPKHYDSTYLCRIKCSYKVVPFIFKKPLANSVQKLKFNSPHTRFLFVGRLVSYKGLEHLISAFNMFDPSDHVSLDIIGHGPCYGELVSISHGNPNITLHGFLEDSDVWHFYDKSHVFCLPSTTKAEAFGIVQVEAMLRYCLCISSDLQNGVNDVNKHNVSGFNIPPSDASALFKAMNSLHQNQSLRNTLMSSAYNYAVSKFASLETKSTYDQLYIR